MNVKIIITSAFVLGVFSANVHADEMNCSLRQNSNFVEDTYGMYDAAKSAEECQLKCETYAVESVESLAENDVITDLSWTCKFNDDDIHTKVLVEDGNRYPEGE